MDPPPRRDCGLLSEGAALFNHKSRLAVRRARRRGRSYGLRRDPDAPRMSCAAPVGVSLPPTRAHPRPGNELRCASRRLSPPTQARPWVGEWVAWRAPVLHTTTHRHPSHRVSKCRENRPGFRAGETPERAQRLSKRRENRRLGGQERSQEPIAMGSWLFSSKRCNFSACELGTHPGAHRLVYVRRPRELAANRLGGELCERKSHSHGT
jgi:hypothetical protein